LTGWVLKVATQDLFAFIVTDVTVFDPLQSPLQPANTEPGAGEAVSITTVPWE